MAVEIFEKWPVYAEMICVVNQAGADGNTYEKITGEAETLDILTFVKEHMKNG